MKVQVNITTAATTLIGTVNKIRDLQFWEATFFVSGTFGGTTVTWQWSPDSGSTLYPITSAPGVAVTSTSADAFDVRLGTGDKNSDHTKIYVTTTGGSGININVGFFDNN